MIAGGWTPTWDGDLCKGGHPPQSIRTDGADGTICDRCGRQVDLTPCGCGAKGHEALSRSFCPNRVREDQTAVWRAEHTGLPVGLWEAARDAVEVVQRSARIGYVRIEMGNDQHLRFEAQRPASEEETARLLDSLLGTDAIHTMFARALIREGYAVVRTEPEARAKAHGDGSPALTWWSISGPGLMDAMRRAAAGEDPDLIYAELYANSESEKPGGQQ